MGDGATERRSRRSDGSATGSRRASGSGRNPSGAIHPTVFLLAWALAGLALEWLLPATLPWPDIADVVAVPFLVLGVGLLAWGMLTFWRAGTPADHTRPTTTLVTTGPFRFSRNPFYVGLLGLMVGFSLEYANLWALLLVAPVAWAIRRYTVLPEEAYLAREFGEQYERYRRSVRRWI